MDKRMAAPIFFSLLVLLFLTAYGSIFLVFPLPLFFKVLVALGLTALGAAMFFVLKERSKEIQEEDKDDLSKY